MASLSKETGRNSWKLRWYDADNKRKAIRLGSMPKKSAEQFRVKFEELLGVRRGGGSIPPILSDWIKNLDDDLRTKIEDAGLIERKRRLTLDGFCEEFKASRSEIAPRTAVRDTQVINVLVEHFGADRMLDSITTRDAEAFIRWLRSDGNQRDKNTTALGDNTVRRRTGVARQIFNTAIRWKLITENPFTGMATTVRANLERREFVTWPDILKVIEKAPGDEWKALIAFVRLTACRVPSELVGLTWADVDFVEKRIVIRSPKTKHHGGEHVMRSCPMFPELVPYLEALAVVVGPGVDLPLSAPVFPMAGDEGVNLRTQLNRMIVRAGLEPWQKLFTNMRSSRETELLAVYPMADVCNWLGHSPAVAAKYYAQSRSEVADKAATETTVQVGPVAGPIGVQNGSETGPVSDRQEASPNRHGIANTYENQGFSTVCEGLDNPAEGLNNRRRGTRTPDIHGVNVAL